MHPAPSIIVFTVLSGLGYGFAFVLCLGVLRPEMVSTKLAWMLALVMIAGGLLSSTFHLGNPQRAWRAVSQWRSSWLSREGVMALLTFIPLTLAAALAIFADRGPGLLGFVGAIMCAITVGCTAMIYGSLRTVQAWATPLTPLCFGLVALAGGGLLATLFAAIGDGAYGVTAVIAAVGLIAGSVAKVAWFGRMLGGAAEISTPETATGLGGIGRVSLLERPHAMGNYLTREMVFRVGRKHADKLRITALVLAALVPLACLALMPVTGLWAFLAAIATGSHLAGMLAERWLFFAEARHSVANYYGA